MTRNILVTLNAAIQSLDLCEEEAYDILMNGTEEDARSVYGEEGKNYLAWCAIANACHETRLARSKLLELDRDLRD
jgi:hypothetical protein